MAGLEPMLEGRFEPNGTILSSLCLGSAASIAATLIPWLLSHATLALHHPFDPLAMRRQVIDFGCTTAILPGSLSARAAASRNVRRQRSPPGGRDMAQSGTLGACPSWQPAWPGLMDVVAFGEAGLMAANRGADGRPAGLIPGPARRNRDGDSERADTGPRTASDRGGAHARGNSGAARPDGATLPVPAGRRARAASSGRCRRLSGYLLSLPRRRRLRRPRRHRPAGRRGQHGRLPLPPGARPANGVAARTRRHARRFSRQPRRPASSPASPCAATRSAPHWRNSASIRWSSTLSGRGAAARPATRRDRIKIHRFRARCSHCAAVSARPGGIERNCLPRSCRGRARIDEALTAFA